MKKSLRLIAVAALAAAWFPAAFAQSPSNQEPSPGMSQSQPEQDSVEAQPSAYTGTVMKSGSNYVLKTDAGTLPLDDQAKVRKFNGKQVTVTGTMDKSTGMLHVTDIAPARQH